MPYRLIHECTPTEIEDFRSLKGKGGHFERGLFIAEGKKIVRKVLESPFEIPSAYMTEEWFRHLLPIFERRSSLTDIFLAPKEEMERVVGYPLHQGLMLAVRIPKSRTLEEAVQEWPSPWMAVALDAIADAENMGGIIRNAAAFGAKAVIVDAQSCNPWLRRSVRVSMGTVVDIEIIRVEDLHSELEKIRRIKPIHLIGAALSEHSIDLASIKPEGDTILIFGSEGWGLRKEILEICDTLAQIPIAPNVDSLNVGVASGIFMNWWRK